MKITCPSCGFEREINTNKIPAKATSATCPKCEIKFTFRTFEETEQVKPEVNTEEIASNSSQLENEIDKSDFIKANEKLENTDENELSASENQDIEKTQEEPKASSEKNEEIKDNDLDNSETSLSNEEKEKQEKEEEDRIRNAHAFYRSQMEKIQELEKQGYSVQIMTMVPFEDPEPGKSFVTKFVQTVVRALFSSPAFFTTMLRPFTISKAVLFYIIIGMLQFVARILTFRFNTPADIEIADPNMQLIVDALLDPSTLFLGLFIGPFVLILQLLIISGLFTAVIKLIEPQKADFSLIVRMIAYASAPGLLSIVPVLGDLVALPWVIFNVIVACRCTLNLSLPKTILTIFAFFIFATLLFLIFFSAV